MFFINEQTVKTYGRVGVKLHTLLTLALDRRDLSAPSLNKVYPENCALICIRYEAYVHRSKEKSLCHCQESNPGLPNCDIIDIRTRYLESPEHKYYEICAPLGYYAA